MLEKQPNFTKKFTEEYIKTLSFTPSPEEILAYIYGVMHSPIYRAKYIEFLKIDFPSVPMTKNKEIFYKYSNLGQKLIDLHLLKTTALKPKYKEIKVNYNDDITNFTISKITKPSATDKSLKLLTNNNEVITFDGITEEIYQFYIGSYKPIEKWLNYRKKDNVTLGISDIEHIKKMALSIQGTISTMNEIKTLGEGYLE